MSQNQRTILFLLVAVVCVVLGVTTHSMYKPSDLDAFVDVGEPFYPDFNDPNEATGLRVASFNDDSSQTDVFSVQNKGDLWRIPSHHDYPADGKDQLAKTAASMVGVKRQALIERTKTAHKRYNLLDPLDKDVTGTEGRGDRITLYKGDEPLVDFIVGKKVDGEENIYYVRAANEDRFYTADLGDLEISTKFPDWIQKDILDITRGDVREIVVNRYQIDEARGERIQGDVVTLTRDSATADWQLEGLIAETEEVNSGNINNLLTAVDDLAIVGVRQKPPGISADLKADSDTVSTTRFDLQDLARKGFFFQQGRILSNEGEVYVGTQDGVVYILRFGEEFSGNEVDIEVGIKSDEKGEAPATAQSEEGEKDPSTSGGSLVNSRYLFVTAQHDAVLLGPKPTPPVKPDPPAEEDMAPKADETKGAGGEEKSAATPPKSDAQKAYEDALKSYAEEQEVYEIQLKNYEAKSKKGQERVAELNRRFADWYYVISEEVFDRMKLNRVDLVNVKEKPVEEPGTPESSTSPATPEMKKPAEATLPAAEGAVKTPAPPKSPASGTSTDAAKDAPQEGRPPQPSKEDKVEKPENSAAETSSSPEPKKQNLEPVAKPAAEKSPPVPETNPAVPPEASGAPAETKPEPSKE